VVEQADETGDQETATGGGGERAEDARGDEESNHGIHPAVAVAKGA
jgi:hypothetical protein